METLSSASACLLHKIPVQLPFHQYETDVYNIVEPLKPVVTNTYIENGANSPIKHGRTSRFATGVGDDFSVFSDSVKLPLPEK